MFTSDIFCISKQRTCEFWLKECDSYIRQISISGIIHMWFFKNRNAQALMECGFSYQKCGFISGDLWNAIS